MIEYSVDQLSNGLKVIVHQDPTVQTAVLNIIYNVGSKDEDPNKTGFAHLFEHLMFGGSEHAPDFDNLLQEAGGENNAFTSPDVTNYYMTLPAANLETAFWLESDRMAHLILSSDTLEVQRKVVIEEFKQRYLNQPYGDVWLYLRPLAYKENSYSWATIGKEIAHIKDATLEDVQHFFSTYYVPNNATLVVGGNVKRREVLAYAEKYFGSIPAGKKITRNIKTEPKQTEKRTLTVTAKVPQRAFYKVYHMPSRMDSNYYATDLLSDILGRGKSSRLHLSLVVEKKMMSTIGSYVTGSFMPGLLVVTGRINETYSFEEIEKEIQAVIDEIISEGVSEIELEKVKNQAEASIVFGRVETLEKCISLAYGEVLGEVDLVNTELNQVLEITNEDIQRVAKAVLVDTNSSVLYYDIEK